MGRLGSMTVLQVFSANGGKVAVFVAERYSKRLLGLTGLRGLPSRTGLLIPDCRSIHTFGMRFPLDVVFVGSAGPLGDRPVVAVHASLPAWTGLVPLVRGAHGVLELPVGTIDRSGTQVGDLIHIG